jgi:tRNA nucleotidyltransferase/poly(A) polymerase
MFSSNVLSLADIRINTDLHLLSEMKQDDEKAEDSASDIYNAAPIAQYLNGLETARKLIEVKERTSAFAILAVLIKDYPDYPHAYVELGDFFRTANPEFACGYYSSALKICSFDYDTQFKLALLTRKYPNLVYDISLLPEDAETIYKNLKTAKSEFTTFFVYHQEYLHMRLTELKIKDFSELALSKKYGISSASDNSNSTIEYVYNGFNAAAKKNFSLAQYYLQTALLLYENDFVTRSELAFIYAELHQPRKAIKELLIIAEKYKYCGTYLRLYRIYYALRDYAQARRHLVNFLREAQYDDMEKVGVLRDQMMALLEYNVFDEKEAKKYQAPKKDLADAYDMPTRLGIPFSELMRKNDTFYHDIILKELNEKIPLFNGSESFYCIRAVLYKKQGEIEEAILNNSLAMWYSKIELNYRHLKDRCINKLQFGDITGARLDYIVMIWLLDKNKRSGEQESIDTLIVNTSYDYGKMYYSENNYTLAEDLFLFGMKIKPSMKLIRICCTTMEKLNKSSFDILNLLTSNVVKTEMTNSEIKEFKILFTNYEIKSRRSISSDQYLTPFPKLNTDAFSFPALPDVEPAKEIRKKKPKKSKPAQLATPRKPSTMHINTLLSEANAASKIAYDEKLIDAMLEEEREQKKLEEEQRKAAKKQKAKSKKEQRRTTRSTLSTASHISDPDTSNETEDKTEIVITENVDLMPSNQEINHVELNDFETNAFSMISDLVPEKNDYKIYLVGGWAYDKIRKTVLGIEPCLYNDMDFTTNIPPEILATKFRAVPEVDGLFCIRLGNVSIDIVYEPDLTNLQRDAKGRDFLTYYIDPDGNVTDPTGFALRNLLNRRLSGVNPPTEMFKDDPLVILRAIYMYTKRQLNINSLRQMIKVDRQLLIPKEGDKLLSPRRINLRFARMFSQHLASANLLELRHFGILEVLFPEMYNDLQQNFTWLAHQVSCINVDIRPRIRSIYSTFVACCVIKHMPEEGLHYPPGILTHMQKSTARHLWNTSLLLQDAFQMVEVLQAALCHALQDWKNYQKDQLAEHQEPQQAIRMSRS